MKVTKFVNKVDFAANLYVVEDKVSFIVDPGFYNNEVASYLKKIGGVSFILLTHGHIDHIFGLDDIVKDYPKCKIYASNEELELINNYRWNCSYDLKKVKYEPKNEIIGLFEGENNLNDEVFELISTPGHTRGSCCYYFKEKQVLFTGDFIFEYSIGRTDLPTGSEVEMYDSLNKFKKLNLPLETKVYPGHDRVSDLKTIIKVNYLLQNN
jgi:glyoxylase-like metal-dependent hydrolase (beta-lactamase superfamily II)